MGAHRTGADTDPPAYDDHDEPRRRDVDRLFRDRELDLPPELRAEVHDAAERLFGAPSEAPYKPGDRLGVYRVVRLLGAGGQAFVYEATHEQLARRVALKVPRPEVAERIIREARLTAPLEHPHIVRVEDIAADREAPFLVMECCTGGSLDQLLERYPNGLPLPDVRTIGKAVLEALEFAHRRGIVHRDVKPANVLFDSRGVPKLADLGIGTVATGGPDLVHSVSLSHATHDGPMGTPMFVAPEQEDPSRLRGAAIDGRADLFSFGKMLFVLLTGASPRTIRPPSRLRPGLDPAWDDLVFKLVEEARDRRPATAREALDLLAKVPEPALPRVRVTPQELEAVGGPQLPARTARSGRAAETVFLLAALGSLAFTGFLHAEHTGQATALKLGAFLGGLFLLWFSKLERRAQQGTSVLAALAVAALFAGWSPVVYGLHEAQLLPWSAFHLASQIGAGATLVLGLSFPPLLQPGPVASRVRVRPRPVGARPSVGRRVLDVIIGIISGLVSIVITTGVLIAALAGLLLVLVFGLDLAPQFAFLVTLKVGAAALTTALFVWFLRRLFRGEREPDAG
jgi:serine/threonine protein kinase